MAAFIVKLGEKEYPIQIKTRSYQSAKSEGNVFTEQNGMVVIYAENYSKKTDRNNYKWGKLPGLGYSQDLMKALPVTEKSIDTLQIKASAISSEIYNFNGLIIPLHSQSQAMFIRYRVENTL